MDIGIRVIQGTNERLTHGKRGHSHLTHLEPNRWDGREREKRKKERGKERECETPRKSNFLKKGKIVILVKIQNFSRSHMTKRTSPLESSREI